MSDELKPIERVETRVPGLDAILGGGLLKGGVYLMMAVPGSGKTILGNQICFNHVAAGGRALYVTLLAESHARMLSALRTMKFFDEQRLANEISYLSGYQALEAEKLEGLLKVLRKAVKDHRATFLVIDGLVTAREVAESELALKEFIHELQSFTEMLGCTTLLLTGTKSDTDANYPEKTMVDGLFQLTQRRFGLRTLREFEVSKLRGSDHLMGGHFFEISNAGVSMYPRTEALLGARSVASTEIAPVEFGVPSLDAMLSGGPLTGSTTLLIGAPGSGKTILGMQFLAAGLKKREPALYFGFFEPPDRLRYRMKHVSLDVAGFERDELLKIVWHPPLELLADALAENLVDAVVRLKAKRLFIDGLAGLTNSLVYPGRTSAFLYALTNELRALGVTTFISDETPQVLGEEMRLPDGISEIVENIVVLRYAEVKSQLRRILSLVKMREGAYDTSMREFSITRRGIEVSGTVGAEGVHRSPAKKSAAKPTRGGKRPARRR